MPSLVSSDKTVSLLETSSSPSKTFFETLANPKRFAIIQYLKDRPARMTAVADDLGFEQSIVSRHLRRLESCGFVSVERRGKERIYTLNKETIEPLMRLVDTHITTYCAKQCFAADSCAVDN